MRPARRQLISSAAPNLAAPPGRTRPLRNESTTPAAPPAFSPANARGGLSRGRPDDYGDGVAEAPVHVHDLHAAIP